MKDIFLLKVIFRDGGSLHHITSTVESIKGARIQRLNFISRGKEFVGTIVVEATNRLDFHRIASQVRKLRNISEVELLVDQSVSAA